MTREQTPVKNACVVLLDSLNRHLLGCYGSDEFETPNLDRFAAQHATRFTNHVTGSLPCMPARHDILCGALDFLWKPWGSIEVWEEPITRVLGHKGVVSYLATDHPHLFETGGENYHVDFGGWNYVRGHEGDLWRTYEDPSWMGTPAMPARAGGWFWSRYGIDTPAQGYDRSRTFFRTAEDYPGPQTMMDAERFLRDASPQHDRWFLFVDEFDPHEPFDTPPPWAGMYHEGAWDDEWIIWPPYIHGGVTGGVITAEEGRHIRANYGAKLTMIDHWFGRILTMFDEQDLWEDTALIVCTDHGHYLGEEREGKDIWGKPGVPQFEPIGHTPLLVSWPNVPGGGTNDALTTNVDIFATIADIYDASVQHRTHGKSLAPLLDGSSTAIREWALGGVWGNWVQVTDGRFKYARSAVESNAPLSIWSNRWSTMPIHFDGIVGMPPPDQRARLDTMPGSDIPVLRQPFESGDQMPIWAFGDNAVGNHYLYDLSVDPDEEENRVGEHGEKEMVELLRVALQSIDSPAEQLSRIGIA